MAPAAEAQDANLGKETHQQELQSPLLGMQAPQLSRGGHCQNSYEFTKLNLAPANSKTAPSNL